MLRSKNNRRMIFIFYSNRKIVHKILWGAVFKDMFITSLNHSNKWLCNMVVLILTVFCHLFHFNHLRQKVRVSRVLFRAQFTVIDFVEAVFMESFFFVINPFFIKDPFFYLLSTSRFGTSAYRKRRRKKKYGRISDAYSDNWFYI